MKHKQSYTLIEILLVMALIAVLTGIAVGGYSYAMNASRESATRAAIKQLGAAFESCKIKHGFYPPSSRITQKSGTNYAKIRLFDTGGAEISDANLASKWKTDAKVYTSKKLPEEYFKTFRRTLDLESLRQYVDSSGFVCDAWGGELLYMAPDTTAKKHFTIRSAGPDGIIGNEDDITNAD